MPAVFTLAVHQNETRCIPQLVAEVAVALAAGEVEVERVRESCKRREGETHGVGAERRDAARIMRPDVFLDFCLVLAAQQPLRGFLEQSLQTDTIDQVDRVERIAL